MAHFARHPRPLDTAAESAMVQRRVANLGLVLTGIGVVFVIMRVVAVLAVGRPEYLLATSMVVHYLATLVSATMWLVCRRGSHTRAVTYGVELIGLLIACSLYTVMAAGIPQAFRPETTLLLAFGVFLMAHSVRVPSSWQWTTIVGTTLALPLFIGAWLILNPMDPRIVAASASANSSVQTTEASIIGIGVASVVTWWVVIVATASTASAVIYGLRQEVRDAMQLGQYRLQSKLGEGGMGAVYRASHSLLRREAAVKLVKANVSEPAGSSLQTNILQRFEREAEVTANLKSPHTIQVYDFGVSAEGSFYYVMELLDGIDLETVVEDFGPLAAERVVFLMRQVCESLEEAHTAGLVHRDIKPANLFLCRYGICYDFIKVLDFGLVALAPERQRQDPKLSTDGFAGGTPAYMAPEMIAGVNAVDGRTDIYSAGCVAYWLLTGHQPFEGRTSMATILAHVKEPPPLPSQVSEIEIPSALERVVMKCLAKEPDDRPASAAELARQLSAAVPDVTWTAERARHWWETHKPTTSARSKPSSTEPTAKVTKLLR